MLLLSLMRCSVAGTRIGSAPGFGAVASTQRKSDRIVVESAPWRGSEPREFRRRWPSGQRELNDGDLKNSLGPITALGKCQVFSMNYMEMERISRFRVKWNLTPT